jgi:predicted  nucleic acid-binding Zn-ribbon protein
MVTPEDEKTEQQKLEEEIAALQTKIKNTEYDLTHMFKGNDIIEQKLHNTKNLMNEKQNRLGELDPTQKKQLEEVKEEIEEPTTTPISQNQEKLLDELIDDEFL